MGIQIGSADGITLNGKQLICPKCGNTNRWGNITLINISAVADCGACGEQVTA